MKIIPDRHYKSISDIDFKALYSQGTRGLLFDIDNTLVKDEAPVDNKSIELFNELRNIGFKCAIVSNNDKKRVEDFATPINCKFVYKVLKPKKEGFIDAINLINVNNNETVMIGDQLITDILGAHNADIKAFLVDPIDRKSERFHIKLKRLIEFFIKLFFKKSFRYF